MLFDKLNNLYVHMCVMVCLFPLYRDRDGVFVDEVVSIVV